MKKPDLLRARDAEQRMKMEQESSRHLLAEIAARRGGGVVRTHNYYHGYYDEKELLLDHSKHVVDLPPMSDENPQVPRAVVLVVTHNCWPYTNMLLTALKAHRTCDYQVRVVDNGSTDGTVDRLRTFVTENESWVDAMYLDENEGLSAALNRGLDEWVAFCDDVVLLNNDVIPEAHWCEGMRRAAYAEPDTGIVGFKLKGMSGRLQHLGAVIKRDFVGDTNLWGREIPDNAVYSGRWYPEAVMFSACYIPSAARAKVPKFDDGYFAYLEDTDYCLQLRRAGMKVVFDGSVSLLHAHNATVRENGMDFTSIFAASRKRFISKWKGPEFTRINDTPVVIRGFPWGLSGYGRHTRELARALDLNGVRVWLNEPLIQQDGHWRHVPTEENTKEMTPHLAGMLVDDPSRGEIIINFSLPPQWVRVPDRINIGMSMLETDGMPDDWVTQCNRMDAVWVPCTEVANMFRRAGVRVPVSVLEGPINTHLFHPRAIPFKMDGDFVRILSVFEWGERKAPEVLLEACGRVAEMMRKDGKEVELVLKTGSNVFEYANDLTEAARRYGLRIQVLSRSIPETLMPSLYKSAAVFVLPSRGEGCGYPFLEAMSVGIPVVGTDCTAQADYLTEETGYPVNWKLTPARALCPYYAGHQWADPDVDHLTESLLRVLTETEADMRPLRARALMEKTYSYEAVARKFKKLIRDVCTLKTRAVPRWAAEDGSSAGGLPAVVDAHVCADVPK